MSTALQPGIVELLELAGANPPRFGRGKWTCPNCQRPALSVNTDKQVFNCHHAGCDFHGGIGTLRKRLGIEREWLPKPEYIRQCRECERVHDAAERLYNAAKARRFELLDQLHDLSRLELSAHDAGSTEAAWGALALVYAERPGSLAGLVTLESASAAQLVRFLTVDDASRQVSIKLENRKGGSACAATAGEGELKRAGGKELSGVWRPNGTAPDGLRKDASCPPPW